MKENCLERMERIDSKRKIADFMIKEKQDYEFKSIQKVHRALGLRRLKSAVRNVDENGTEHRWSKPQIIQEFGFPVLSKEIATKIETLANPTEKK